MSTIYIQRQATAAEMAAEIDRRGAVIVDLEARLATVARDTAQAVAAEREACAKLLDDAATHLDQTGALKAAVRRLFKLADDMRARGGTP